MKFSFSFICQEVFLIKSEMDNFYLKYAFEFLFIFKTYTKLYKNISIVEVPYQDRLDVLFLSFFCVKLQSHH